MVKRRTSTSVSSAGTPGPSAGSVPPTTTTSPVRPGDADDEGDRAGPSRTSASASATPAPKESTKEKLLSSDYRPAARPGIVAPGTGDGAAAGDECFMWNDLPMNKNGYRYYPCAPGPVVSPNPLFPFNRIIAGPLPAPAVAISTLDRSSFLRIAPNSLTVTTDRGYRSGRATVSVRQGVWYYEAIVVRGEGPQGAGKATGGDSGNAHVRVGWGRREAGLDAPVGADAYAYGIRDVGGEKVHLSRPKPYGKPFATGDVIGCLISLPPRDPPLPPPAEGRIQRWRIPIRYKGQLYFEMDEYPVAKEFESLVNREGKAPEPPAPEEEKKKGPAPKKKAAEPAKPVTRQINTLPGSYISFFLNGQPLAPDPAFTDLWDFAPLPPVPSAIVKRHGHGTVAAEREREAYHHIDDGILGYFPMVSCFGRGKVRLNFGPHWEAPPTGLPDDARAMSARWDEFVTEQALYDEHDEGILDKRYRREAEEAARRAAADAAATGTPSRGSRPPPNKKRKKGPGDIGTPGTSSARGTPAPADGGVTPATTHGGRTPAPLDGGRTPAYDTTAPPTPAPVPTPYDDVSMASTPGAPVSEAVFSPMPGVKVEEDEADAEGEDAGDAGHTGDAGHGGDAGHEDAEGAEDADEGVQWS
ncbi:transcription factor, contains a PHD finger motif [Vanrija albida]|uniref:Transcription factor, contains a PHD finger motif n=1 Tax=Vanrija albida TaxID=181172 RepID=A0ABR3PYM1_9TREE